MSNADSSPSSSGIRAAPTKFAPLPPAWQPITPRGVASFSRARIGRLLIAQLIFAAAAAGTVCWFLTAAWFPVAKQAISQLPDSGGITNGVLSLPHTSIEPVAQNRFLAFVIDLEGRTGADVPADVLITLRRGEFRVCSLFGCLSQSYERRWEAPVTRLELEAAWGAWRPTVLVMAAGGTMVALFASWFTLATLACPLVRLYSFFKDRDITLLGSWKLAGAALLPGALVAIALIVLYGLGAIDLVRFLIGWLLHLPIGVVYLVTAPLTLTRSSSASSTSTNPFTSPSPDADKVPPSQRAVGREVDPRGD